MADTIMSDAQDKVRSTRLACERCRSQKLKCPQNKHATNGGACQRCLRAKIQCTFSPRARTGRPSEQTPSESAENGQSNLRKRKRKGRTARNSVSEDNSHEDGQDDSQSFLSGYDRNLESTEITKMPDPQWEQYRNLNSLSAPSQTDAADLDTSAFDHNDIVDFINHTDLSSFSFPNPTTPDSMAALLHETQFELGAITWDPSHDFYFPANTPRMVSSDTPPTAGGGGTNPRASSPSYSSGYTDGYCTQKLSALAVDFHRHLRIINHGPWVKHDAEEDRQSCFRNYPIGDILHLSQELINVVRCVSLNAGFRPDSGQSESGDQRTRKSPGIGEDSPQKSPSQLNMVRSGSPSSVGCPMSPDLGIRSTGWAASDRPPGHIDVDTPTALLILNCYVSLIQTYTVVLAHLHQYLRSVPFLRSPGLIPQLPPGLQFGELSPSTEACTRTHVAYRNLVETLGRSEDVLDLPNHFRCVGVRADGNVKLQSDQARRKSMNSNDEEGSNSSSDVSDVSNVARTGHCTGLLRVELVEAALKNESLIEERNGGKCGVLDLLRKNMRRVKQALRQRMAL